MRGAGERSTDFGQGRTSCDQYTTCTARGDTSAPFKLLRVHFKAAYRGRFGSLVVKQVGAALLVPPHHPLPRVRSPDHKPLI